METGDFGGTQTFSAGSTENIAWEISEDEQGIQVDVILFQIDKRNNSIIGTWEAVTGMEALILPLPQIVILTTLDREICWRI